MLYAAAALLRRLLSMAESLDQTYRRPGVKAWNTNKAVPLPNPSPGLIYGVELEIENANQDWAVAGMSVTTDGSLRHNGLEFITSPMTYSNMMHVLTNFFGNAKMPPDGAQLGLAEELRNYSERCSVHVHTNVGNLTFDQLASLCILYQVFESCLFNFVGNDRQKNIFTVPWSETQLSYRTVERLAGGSTDTIRGWQKYTALNLLPIGDKGSIEWRHLNGTSDVEKIGVWLRLIGHMFRVATTLTRQEVAGLVMSLNTTSLYRGIIEQVFQTDAKFLQIGDYARLIEDGVLNMKYSLVEPNSEKEKKNPYREMVANFQAGIIAAPGGVDQVWIEPLRPEPVNPEPPVGGFVRANIEMEAMRLVEARLADERRAMDRQIRFEAAVAQQRREAPRAQPRPIPRNPERNR